MPGCDEFSMGKFRLLAMYWFSAKVQDTPDQPVIRPSLSSSHGSDHLHIMYILPTAMAVNEMPQLDLGCSNVVLHLRCY